ncbi:hypothetical protein Tco_1375766 [Tanacetum coccineum]
MDTAYGSSLIRRIRNWSNALSCEVLALIRRISFVGYGIIREEFVKLLLDSFGKLSIREILSVDEPEAKLLPNFSPLDVNLGDKRDPGDSVRINPDGVARPATGKFEF